MFSRHKLLAALIAVPAVVAAGLVVAPAQAAGGLVFVSNTPDRSIAVYDPDAVSSTRALGTTLVQVKCTAATTCTGTARYDNIRKTATGAAIRPDAKSGLAYSVGAGKTATIQVYLNTTDRDGLANNQDLWTEPGWGASVSKGQGAFADMTFTQSVGGPVVNKDVYLTQRIPFRYLKGKVTGSTSGVSDRKIWRWAVSGLQSSRVSSADVASDGTYEFKDGNGDPLKFTLGVNNLASGTQRLSIRADVNGSSREWFWRGKLDDSGDFTGGSNDLREAQPIEFNQDSDFDVNFTYGTISGNLSNSGSTSSVSGAEVDVDGAPYAMPTALTDLRSMDSPYCAHNFGTDTTDGSGNYSVPFLPTADSGNDKRYIVNVAPVGGDSGSFWFGSDLGSKGYGSCLNARDYTSSTTHLISIPTGGSTTRNASLYVPTGSVKGTINYQIDNALAVGDKGVSLREYLPGQPVLDGSFVARSSASSAGVYSFDGVKPGTYWLEVGRRTSCANWYPSAYANNDVYLEGLDRGAEIWKAFTTLGALKTISQSQNDGMAAYNSALDHGALAAGTSQPSSLVGWMYRDFCKTGVAGSYQKVTVSTDAAQDTTVVNPVAKEGGVLKGKIVRTGKSTKEMLVEVHSTNGTLARRTAITDATGNFRIYGIQPGTYIVDLNTDSWRGIGRTFTGIHSITIGTSTTVAYNAGTLTAKF